MASWTTLTDGHVLVEGPRPDAGGVLFSDVVAGGVHRWTPDGVATVLAGRRGIGGLVRHADGGVVATGRDVVHGERTLLAAPDGVTGFNDLITTDDGGLLVGALRFRPMAGEEPVPAEVWRVAPDGAATILLDGILWPNGIGLSPDGATVYVSDFAAGEVIAFDGQRHTFARVPGGSPDGLAVDAEGGVWVALGAAGAIARYDADGTLRDTLDVPADFVASVAFAPGALLVATAGALLRTDAPVGGRPVRAAAVRLD